MMGEQLRRISYLHICAYNQNPGVQGEAFQQARCEPMNIFEANGNESFATPTTSRQSLDLSDEIDELIVYHLDCLSRSEQTRCDLLQQLQAMGATLVVASDNHKTIGDGHEEY